MEPIGKSHGALVDLLDRVLDKGLVIQADLIISVAGVPLIGVNLRAALAGIETMREYGMMREWEESIRAEGGMRPVPPGSPRLDEAAKAVGLAERA